jgi:hypothetical protein
VPSLVRSAYTLPSALPANTLPGASAIPVTVPLVGKLQSAAPACCATALPDALGRDAGPGLRPGWPPAACGEPPRVSSHAAPASPAPVTTASPIRARRRVKPRSAGPAVGPAPTRSAGMAGPASGGGPAGAVARIVGRTVGPGGSCSSTAAPAAAGVTWPAADGTSGAGTPEAPACEVCGPLCAALLCAALLCAAPLLPVPAAAPPSAPASRW